MRRVDLLWTLYGLGCAATSAVIVLRGEAWQAGSWILPGFIWVAIAFALMLYQRRKGVL